jgi:hypothetical protein
LMLSYLTTVVWLQTKKTPLRKDIIIFYKVNERKCYHPLYLGSGPFESAMTQTIWTGFFAVFHIFSSPVLRYSLKLCHSNSHAHSFEFIFHYHSTIKVCVDGIKGSAIK